MVISSSSVPNREWLRRRHLLLARFEAEEAPREVQEEPMTEEEDVD